MTSLSQTSKTLFAVARDGQPINDDGAADLASAKNQLLLAEDGMRAAGLEPDLGLVEIEMRTSYGKPKAVLLEQPAAEVEPEELEQQPETPPVQ